MPVSHQQPWVQTIPSLCDAALSAKLQHALDHKTKPVGALGRLEQLAHQIGLILGTEQPRLREPQVVVFAGDHGLAARGVSAYPSEVTAQMVLNFLSGGAAINVLARQHGLALTVVDAGVAAGLPSHPCLQHRKVARGTADSSQGLAMTREQCEQALREGVAVVAGLPGNALVLGEMGIGNTSSAALIMARLTGLHLAHCLGRGTGLADEAMRHKHRVLESVLQRHHDVHEPLEVLQAFGGFEMAMMCGAMLEGAAQNRVIVVDGFIASSAVMVAHALQPTVLQRCVFSHRSNEQGHGRMLAYLGVEPLLQLDLRLGEGSGAALVWPLLESACRLLCEMASFESAGVSTSPGAAA